MNIEKIRKILEDKYERMRSELWDEMKPEDYSSKFARKMDEFWTEYMNSLDCILITDEDIKEDLEGIINNSSRGRVCIRMGEEDLCDEDLYILMPQELADKVLVLGGLPDFAEA